MKSRWFTPQSARRALDELRPEVERIRRLYRKLEALRPLSIRPDEPVDPGYYALVEALVGALAEVGRSGARVRDPRRGLVDFPARRGGQEVALCWMVGEPALAWWHEVDAIPGARRPLDAEGPWDEPELEGAG